MTNTFDGPFLAIPKWAFPTVVQNPSALQVLCGLVEHMDIRTKVAKVPIGELSDVADLSRKTVQRALRWLESEGVISTQQSTCGVSSYTIKYTQRGVTGVQGVGHGCPGGRSRVTGGEVTGDLPNGVKNSDLPGICRNPIENDIESIKEQVEKGAAGSPRPKGKTMILGGDHEHEAKKERRQQLDSNNRSVIKPLVSRFLNHPKQFHRAKPPEADVLMLRRTIKRLLDGGMSPPTVTSLIELFMNSHFGQYDDVIRAFSSKKVQGALLKKLHVSVKHEDPVLQFLAQDCQRSGLSLPWSEDHDAALQMILARKALEASFRYPELVAQIINHWPGDFDNSEFLSALSDLEAVIKHGLGTVFVDVPEILERLTMVDLPKGLLNGTVRESPDTMAVSVYASRRSPNA